MREGQTAPARRVNSVSARWPPVPIGASGKIGEDARSGTLRAFIYHDGDFSCGMGVCERRRKCVTEDILNLPTDLSEFDESPAEFESDRAKAALIARSKHIKAMGNDTEVRNESCPRSASIQIRKSPSKATITDSSGCDGSDVDRKTCDAGPCCVWDMWTEWSPCIGCGSTAMIRRGRQCTVEGSTGRRGMPPLSFQEDTFPRQSYIMGGTPGTLTREHKAHSFRPDGVVSNCPYCPSRKTLFCLPVRR